MARTTSRSIRINADGTVDASTVSVQEDAAAPTLVASGSFGFNDVDLTDTHTVSAAAAAGNTLGGSLAATLTTQATGAALGQVDWTYTLANSATQQLAQGQQVTESFDVTVDDGHGGTVSKSIDVPPYSASTMLRRRLALADQGASEGSAFAYTIPAGAFTDVDGDALSYSATLASGAALPAWLSFDAGARSFSGTPPNGSAGTIVVRVSASDGSLTAFDDFQITVGDVNVPPTGAPTAVLAAGAEDTSYLVSAASLLQGFSDADGDTLSVANLSADHGSVTDNGNGSFTITPAANYNGPVSLNYNVVDGNGGSLAATQGFGLTAVNDAPVNTVLGAQTVNEDQGQAINGLSISDVDAGAGTLTTTLHVGNGLVTSLGKTFGSQYANVVGSGTGDVTLSGTLQEINASLATVAYAGNANFNGSDTLSMTTSDGGNTGGAALTDIDTVTINVTAVNDAPFFSTVDESFNGDGRVTTDFDGVEDVATAVLLLEDGRFVVAGGDGSVGEIARYNADGSLDTTFGVGGKVTAGPFVVSIALQLDGKLLATGRATQDFAVLRFNADGSLDSTFGGGAGQVVTGLGAGTLDIPQSVAIQADGKIVVAGYTQSGSVYDFALVRYDAAGNLDTTFGVDGKATTDIGANTVDVAWAVAVQADGKIIAVGQSGNAGGAYDIAVVRYNTDGTLDATFGGVDGKVTTTFAGSNQDRAYSVLVQPDGKVVVAGAGYGVDFSLVRYNTDGSLDGTFGVGGMVLTDFAGNQDVGLAVVRQPDGRLLVAGLTTAGPGSDFAVARYNSDGSLDLSFGVGGKVTVDTNGTGYATIALRPDGHVVVAGSRGGAAGYSDFYARPSKS